MSQGATDLPEGKLLELHLHRLLRLLAPMPREKTSDAAPEQHERRRFRNRSRVSRSERSRIELGAEQGLQHKRTEFRWIKPRRIESSRIESRRIESIKAGFRRTEFGGIEFRVEIEKIDRTRIALSQGARAFAMQVHGRRIHSACRRAEARWCRDDILQCVFRNSLVRLTVIRPRGISSGADTEPRNQGSQRQSVAAEIADGLGQR